MYRPTSPPDFSAATRSTQSGQPVGSVRLWLVAGASAGPVLIVSSLVQGSLRTGFEFAEHPPSALALGSAGLIQQVTFVLAGLLLSAGALGMRHGSCGRWAPRLVAVLGGSLAAAGLFKMDPAFGFPPGTPPGVGDTVSWHAAVHGVLFPIGFVALVGAAVLMGRRFGRAHRRRMQMVTYLAATSSLVLSMWPNLSGEPDGRFLPMWLGVVVGYLWTSLLFVDLLHASGRKDRPYAGAEAGR